jgi:23S rRNA (cytosine1962-C5)-methyltransferase
MKRIILKPGEEKRILEGHPWVYDNEIAKILDPGGVEGLAPGELADVESAGKTYLGRALVNPHSKIRARIYSPSKEGMDKGFFKRRFREALARRSTYDLYRESARLLFAEADFCPGLIVDRFVGWSLDAVENAVQERPLTFDRVEAALGPPLSWLAVQFLIFGTDIRQEEILNALEEVLAKDRLAADKPPLGLPAGIIEKSGVKVRELEGLALRQGLIKGNVPAGIVIFENSFPFCVHLEEGQKTGHFLDQKENRHRLARFISKGSTRVLDACTYTGGFAIHAARFGAALVHAVDVSKDALKIAEHNAQLNGVATAITLIEADIFTLLRAYQRNHLERFDLIILDPPAFAKTRSSLQEALRGYKEINLQALKLLAPGGLLLTCSCSHALDEGCFKNMICEAAADAERSLIQVDFRYQALDHPIRIGYDESLYLKCGFYKVL